MWSIGCITLSTRTNGTPPNQTYVFFDSGTKHLFDAAAGAPAGAAGAAAAAAAAAGACCGGEAHATAALPRAAAATAAAVDAEAWIGRAGRREERRGRLDRRGSHLTG